MAVFFKMAAVRYLGFVGHILGPPKYLDVFVIGQILVGIHSVVFIIWNLKYFSRLAGKCLFRTPKLGVLWQFDPLNEEQY